jgi:putative NADH-flavin reductase
MKITLLGSTGLVGKVILEKAIAANHEVTVLVRNPSKLGDYGHKVNIIEGDYFNSNDIDKAVKGANVVISSASPRTNERDKAISKKFETAMKNLLSTLKVNGIKRFIFYSGAAIQFNGEKVPGNRKMIRSMLRLFNSIQVETKDLEMDLVSASGLDYTLIRPGMVKNNVKGEFHSTDRRLGASSVDIEQLADFTVEQIHNTEWIKKAPVVWTK